MPVGTVLVVCEAEGDVRVAQGFVERVFAESENVPDWFKDLEPTDRLAWRGVLEGSGFLRWTKIAEVYKEAANRNPKELPPVFSTKILGKPPLPEATNTRKALLLARRIAPSAVVLMTDVDMHEDRKLGVHQGREEFLRLHQIPVVVATPDRYREAWLLAGFVAQNQREQQQLETIKKALDNLDPCQEPHRLRGAEGDVRCAKDIWNTLSNNDIGREVACWAKTPLETLKTRGQACLLTNFLNEVQEVLCRNFHQVFGRT
jgi:hypothetical protein